jgi:TonB family protein
MKNKSIIIVSLIALIGLCNLVYSQTKSIPSPGVEIPFDKAPDVVKRVDPAYPASMLSGGWEASVYIRAFIDLDGNVAEVKTEKIEVTATRTTEKKDVEVEDKADGKAFEEAALSALKQWKFTPAQMKGKTVAVWVTIPFKFKLSTKELKEVEEPDKVETKKQVETIKTAIENILRGEEIEKAKACVSKDALIVYNTKTANLISVINGEQKDIHLTEGKEAKNVNMNIKVLDGGKSAVIVVTTDLPKGKGKHVHSIILSRSAENLFRITHWHVSF